MEMREKRELPDAVGEPSQGQLSRQNPPLRSQNKREGTHDTERMTHACPEPSRGDPGRRMPDTGHSTRDAGRKGFEPSILVFACNWCSYAGADLAGVSRVQMPPNCTVVRVMCSGRVNPELVFSALSKGVDGVMILGCHPGECHYSEGNYHARRRALLLKEFLPYLGIERERFQVNWVSASEGGRFAEVVEKMVRELRDLGPVASSRYREHIGSRDGEMSCAAVRGEEGEG